MSRLAGNQIKSPGVVAQKLTQAGFSNWSTVNVSNTNCIRVKAFALLHFHLVWMERKSTNQKANLIALTVSRVRSRTENTIVDKLMGKKKERKYYKLSAKG